MGQKLQGIARDSWTGILITYQHLIPHYPGTTIIKPARIPAPPKLTGDRDHDALLCWIAYEATGRHYFKVFARGSYASRLPSLDSLYELPMRQHRLYDRAARMLLERNTQPMVWCAWVCKSWQTYGPLRFRMRRPPITWVYSTKRMKEKNDLFGALAGAERGAKLVFAPAHKTLITKWELMRAALMQAHLKQGLTERTVSSIVRASLGTREFQTLVHRAHRQTVEKQSEIDHSIASGDYVWG